MFDQLITGRIANMFRRLFKPLPKCLELKCLAPKYSQNDKFRERFLRDCGSGEEQ